MIKVEDTVVEINGEADLILAEFVIMGMHIKEILNNMEDSIEKSILFNEFQSDLIKMYKYNSPAEFMEAENNNRDINIRELFGLED